MLEAFAQLIADPALGAFSALPFTMVTGLLGGAVGYGMVKGKVDATQQELRAMEGRIEKRLDRLEGTLDEIQSDLRKGGRYAS